jgi:cold shock CspA family protein
MKHSGTVQSFDVVSGYGSITPDNGGSQLGFQIGASYGPGINSPEVGQRLSYHLSGKTGHASAVDVRRTLSTAHGAKRSPFTIFQSAAEEAASRVNSDTWEKEGGHMSSTEGRVVCTPNADLPYKVVLKHGNFAETDCCFATMREAEAFIRRNTPSPIAWNTLRDQEACAL